MTAVATRGEAASDASFEDEPQSTILEAAAALIGDVRAHRLHVGDHRTARRLERLARFVTDEAEVLLGCELWDLPMPAGGGPGRAALGWFLRFDPHTRRARTLIGLPVPTVGEL
jgi:hypothetical protein